MDKRYQFIKNLVLPKSYELSLVFADKDLMRKLNLNYRKKNKPTDVLAFPLEKNIGEIFINKEEAKERREYLFVHALLHLKGLNHSLKMDKEEKKILKKITIEKMKTRKERKK